MGNVTFLFTLWNFLQKSTVDNYCNSCFLIYFLLDILSVLTINAAQFSRNSSINSQVKQHQQFQVVLDISKV